MYILIGFVAANELFGMYKFNTRFTLVSTLTENHTGGTIVHFSSLLRVYDCCSVCGSYITVV